MLTSLLAIVFLLRLVKETQFHAHNLTYCNDFTIDARLWAPRHYDLCWLRLCQEQEADAQSEALNCN